MKRFFLVLPLGCAALLLSGCPDAKLPTPTPTVPTPKAQEALYQGEPQTVAKQPLLTAMPVKASRS